jgi:hypothetical protein
VFCENTRIECIIPTALPNFTAIAMQGILLWIPT